MDNEKTLRQFSMIGGEPAKPGREFVVSIGKSTGVAGNGAFPHNCGGALIDGFHVLTAAHCLVDEKTGLPLSPDKLQVFTGSQDLSDQAGRIIDVESVVVHQDYLEKIKNILGGGDFVSNLLAANSGLPKAFFAPMFGNDLGILSLVEELADIEVIRLPKAVDDFSEILLDDESQSQPLATLTGWGVLRRRPLDQLIADASQFADDPLAAKLREGEQPVVSQNKCQSIITDWFKENAALFSGQSGGLGELVPLLAADILDPIIDKIRCAGEMKQGSVSFCSGDSGSPLFLDSQLIKIRQGGEIKTLGAADSMQLGLVSFSLGCNTLNFPDIYTRVSAHYDWITAHAQ